MDEKNSLFSWGLMGKEAVTTVFEYPLVDMDTAQKLLFFKAHCSRIMRVLQGNDFFETVCVLGNQYVDRFMITYKDNADSGSNNSDIVSNAICVNKLLQVFDFIDRVVITSEGVSVFTQEDLAREDFDISKELQIVSFLRTAPILADSYSLGRHIHPVK